MNRKHITNDKYKLIYNTEFDYIDGFYYIVKDIKTNNIILADTGFESSKQALEYCEIAMVNFYKRSTSRKIDKAKLLDLFT